MEMNIAYTAIYDGPKTIDGVPHSWRLVLANRSGGYSELKETGDPRDPTFVAMMQAANFWERKDRSLFRPLDRSRFRRIFLQSQVSPAPVIVCEIGCK